MGREGPQSPRWGQQLQEVGSSGTLTHMCKHTRVLTYVHTHAHRCLHQRVPHPCSLTFVPHSHTPFHVHAHTHTPANTKDKYGGIRATHTHPVTPYTYTLHTHKHAHTPNTHTGACSFRSPPTPRHNACTPTRARLPTRTQAPTPAHARTCAPLTLAVRWRSPTRRRTRSHSPARTHSLTFAQTHVEPFPCYRPKRPFSKRLVL